MNHTGKICHNLRGVDTFLDIAGKPHGLVMLSTTISMTAWFSFVSSVVLTLLFKLIFNHNSSNPFPKGGIFAHTTMVTAQVLVSQRLRSGEESAQ